MQMGFLQSILVSLICVSVGIINPMVSVLSSRVRNELGATFWTSGIAYATVSVVACPWALLTPLKTTDTIRWRYGVRHTASFVRYKWYHCFILCSGCLGIFNFSVGQIAVSSVGTGIHALLLATAQLCASTLLDYTGWAWASKNPIGPLLICGVVCSAIGAALYQTGNILNRDIENEIAPVLIVSAMILTFLSGIAMTLQGALGRELGNRLGLFRRAMAWAYPSGAALGLILAGVFEHGADLERLANVEWWCFLSGLMGSATVVCGGIAPRYIPMANVWSCFILGQLASSAAFDATGWLGVTRTQMSPWSFGGLAVVLVGVALATYAQIQRNGKQESKKELTDVKSLSPATTEYTINAGSEP